MEPYDFVIIGGGSAGYAAAEQARRCGLRTAVIQGSREFGGLCIQKGCMPSKLLLESANRFHALEEAKKFGVHPGNAPSFSAREIIERKRRLVGEFAEARKQEIQDASFELILGQAAFIDPHTIEINPLDEGHPSYRINALTALIATGSRVKRTPFPGLEEVGVMTSDEALDSDHIPPSLIILGAGPVGLEAAHYYTSLGTGVTVLNPSEHLLGSMDEDVSAAVTSAMEERGTKFHHGVEITSLSTAPGLAKRVHFTCQGEQQFVDAAEILSAIGREPCTDAVGLENAGVTLDERQHAKTKPTLQTMCPHIFAAGDAAGPYEILHLAVRQGEVAGRNAARHLGKLDGEMEKMNYRLKLQAIFTEPEVASVGMTEKEAHAANLDFHAASYPFREHGRAIVEGATDGLVKLVAERGSSRILGAAIVGPRGAELIHEMVAVMHYRGTVEDLLEMPHYHPTLSEIWRSVAEKLAEE